ncbi:hypothetical protein WOLCODRAFT_22815 [Wolfiporia cocos MD-104 SS10]|uniref:BTB domain-containing protein n=1 Tax=Wolfiporia cocos (strain MD-104) TaxID=742152 RepID=A0A2H3J7Y3_WOLCO|nr:hypothetical protein WOLCODRAFT_22815 [Wolfiporia cocos MD-104 SS10]
MHGFPFVPRPFPPPALADVPLEYIIDQLRRLASHYWSKPETSDCTIVVPLDTKAAVPTETGVAPGPSHGAGEFGLSQQAEEPAPRPTPRMVMQLHMDYLCAHSALLRGLLSGASPFDLIDGSSASPISSRPSSTSGAAPQRAPLFPSLLPSSPTHPSILLPVPDPASFRLLVHYIYFGSTSYIEDALDDGTLSWEGIARNVEYLGMGAEIKIFLGRWYGRWRRGRASEGYSGAYTSDSESEAGDDSDDDDYEREQEVEMLAPHDPLSAATSPTVFDPDEEYYKDKGEQVVWEVPRNPPRGRDRTTRRLGHSTSAPTLGQGNSRLFMQDSFRTPRGRSK